jgi:hypothetical protein
MVGEESGSSVRPADFGRGAGAAAGVPVPDAAPAPCRLAAARISAVLEEGEGRVVGPGVAVEEGFVAEEVPAACFRAAARMSAVDGRRAAGATEGAGVAGAFVAGRACRRPVVPAARRTSSRSAAIDGGEPTTFRSPERI